MANQLYGGVLNTDAGVAIVGATADLLDRNTTTPVRATTTTNASGYWAISHATEGRFDVRITNGSSVRWHKYDTEEQITTLEVANFNIRNPADTFDYNILPAAITADRTLTLPLITGTDTLAVLGLAQTFTVAKTFSVAGLTATFVNTTDGASSQVAIFEGDRATPADNDLAYISLRLSDSAGNQDEQARIEWQATTVLNGATQDGDMVLYALVNNTLTEMLRLDGSASEIDMAVDVDYVAAAVRWSSGVAVVAGEYSVQRDADGTNQLHFNVPTGATYEWSTNDVSQMVFGAGILYLGDTANANMTTGLTINQGAADNQILDFKSSDVATGLTTLIGVETDDFTEFRKFVATTGGVQLRGLSSATRTIRLDGWAQTDTTTKTAAANAGIEIVLNRHNGANAAAAFTADSNILVIGLEGNGGYFTRYIFDIEGSAHADVEFVAFDDYDDLLALDQLQALTAGSAPRLTPERYGGNPLAYNREKFEEMGIVGRDSWHVENGRQRQMVNFTKLAMLHHGSILQLADRTITVEGRIEALETENARLRLMLEARN